MKYWAISLQGINPFYMNGWANWLMSILIGGQLHFERAKVLLAIGAMGLANTAKYAGSEWPLVCKVLSLNIGNNTAKVMWYKGAKTTTWTPCKRRE